MMVRLVVTTSYLLYQVFWSHTDRLFYSDDVELLHMGMMEAIPRRLRRRPLQTNSCVGSVYDISQESLSL
jgi:hypothetical protein